MIESNDITGLVLAGGRGSRMGGVDKGLQNFRGLPLALHTLMRLQMQVGATNGWRRVEGRPSAELLARLRAALPLVPLSPTNPGETAERWGYTNAQG